MEVIGPSPAAQQGGQLCLLGQRARPGENANLAGQNRARAGGGAGRLDDHPRVHIHHLPPAAVQRFDLRLVCDCHRVQTVHWLHQNYDTSAGVDLSHLPRNDHQPTGGLRTTRQRGCRRTWNHPGLPRAAGRARQSGSQHHHTDQRDAKRPAHQPAVEARPAGHWDLLGQIRESRGHPPWTCHWHTCQKGDLGPLDSPVTYHPSAGQTRS